MKKLCLLLISVFIVTGCTDNEQNLRCESSVTSGNLMTTTLYDITYEDDDVKYVKITYDYEQDVDPNEDGVGTGTDGTTEDTDEKQDGIVDGKVGDAIDEVVDTILDLSGVRTMHTNRLNTYNNLEGFNNTVDVDMNNRYKIIYEIDLEKMDDADLATFGGIDRSLTTLRGNLEDLDLTCK